MKLAVLLCIAVVCGDACAEDVREELASYLETQESNWATIKQMDVLCRTDALGEPGNRPGFTETVLERFMFDFSRDRYLYARTGVRKSLADGEPSLIAETGFIISEGRVRSFQVSVPSVKPVTTKETVFDYHRVPDLRTIMFMGRASGRTNGRDWTGNRINRFRTYPHIATSVKFLDEIDGHVGFEAYFANESGYRWRFDLERLVPVKSVWLIKNAENKQVITHAKETYEWDDVGAIMVPTTVEGSYRFVELSVTWDEIHNLPRSEKTWEKMQKLKVITTIERDTRLKWFSVNKALKDEYFDIDTPGKFFALCDPLQSGARELSSDIIEE